MIISGHHPRSVLDGLQRLTGSDEWLLQGAKVKERILILANFKNLVMDL
jgi:hypothetical protein